MRSSAALNANLRFALAQAAARPRVRFMDEAVRERLASLGATPSEIGAATSAGAMLVAAIDASSSSANMDSAFADYHDEIVSVLRMTAGTHATAIDTLDTTIRGDGGAKLALETAVSMAASTLAIANTPIDFRESVSTLRIAELHGATTAEAAAVAEILSVTNMSFSML